MKKTNHIFKSIIAIATITTFIACKKEIQQPLNDVNTSYKMIPATPVVNPPAYARGPKGYAGNGTLADSTKATN